MTANKILGAAGVALLASCSAFTAPKDQVTGIRQDAPPEWAETSNPLDTPAVTTKTPTADGRFGHSNKGLTW